MQKLKQRVPDVASSELVTWALLDRIRHIAKAADGLRFECRLLTSHGLGELDDGAPRVVGDPDVQGWCVGDADGAALGFRTPENGGALRSGLKREDTNELPGHFGRVVGRGAS